MPARLRVVVLGAAVALAVALPAALAIQVVEAVRDNGTDDGPLTYGAAVVVLAGMVLGGWTVGRRAVAGTAALGGLAGLVAIAVVLALGITRRLVAGDEVAWSTVPATTVVSAGLAAGAAALAARGPGRTRP